MSQNLLDELLMEVARNEAAMDGKAEDAMPVEVDIKHKDIEVEVKQKDVEVEATMSPPLSPLTNEDVDDACWSLCSGISAKGGGNVEVADVAICGNVEVDDVDDSPKLKRQKIIALSSDSEDNDQGIDQDDDLRHVIVVLDTPPAPYVNKRGEVDLTGDVPIFICEGIRYEITC
jgi:hypothetical protein